ncbi:MAG: zeta toxin family protein [Patescibacteria group bacterium]|nr:zeta toxin family protein [Patescibacteria group bacterium]
MTDTEGKEALAFIKTKRKEIIERFANDEKCPTVDNPVSFFMAGSPGAGKTEVSKRFIKEMKPFGANGIARIDADEIRDLIPAYDGTNAYLFQGAAAKGVEILHDHALHKSKNLLLDGTMHDFARAKLNTQRSLKRNRKVVILYIYQDPVVAWEFTRKREMLEGRRVPKEFFIETLFLANETANRLKTHFGKSVELWLVEKNPRDPRQEKFTFNIDNIDNHVRIRYSKEELRRIL